MKKLKMMGLGLLSVGLLGLSPLAAHAETATVSSPASGDSGWVDGINPDFDVNAHRGEEIRVGTSWEDSVPVGRVGGSQPSDEPEFGVMNIPFSPVDIYECNLQNNADHVIAEMVTFPYSNGGETLWSGGDVDLLCGTEYTSGFKHIRERHQYGSPEHPNSFEDVRGAIYKVSGSQPVEPWDFFMWEAVNKAVLQSDVPVYVNYNQQKSCFHAPYRIFTSSNVTIAEWTINVILSRSNYTVISAFFSDQTGQHDCGRWSGE